MGTRYYCDICLVDKNEKALTKITMKSKTFDICGDCQEKMLEYIEGIRRTVRIPAPPRR